MWSRICGHGVPQGRQPEIVNVVVGVPRRLSSWKLPAMLLAAIGRIPRLSISFRLYAFRNFLAP